MSAKHVYVLTCDAPGCVERFALDLPRADQTRQIAAQRGWRNGFVAAGPARGPTRMYDYCRAHADLGEDLRPKALPEHAREVDA